MSDFRVSSTTGEVEGVTFYFIESTAPDHVDPPFAANGANPQGLNPVPPDEAVQQIANLLIPQDDPEAEASLVVMVHGFNNPRPNVLKFYEGALEALRADGTAIFGDRRRRVVCVGYRWPSESIGQVLSSSFKALPILPLWLFGFACVVLLLRLIGAIAGWIHWGPDWLTLLFNLAWGLTLLAVALFALIVVVVLLRGIVYFRDIYRATNYGVPDLVEVIRQIDLEAVQLADRLRKQDGITRKRIALSFIGHSMGGLVVTNAIRVLSDVFDKAVIRTRLSGEARSGPAREAPDGEDLVTGKIGHVFTLMRFVLASPDVPAETLLADRANFLASSLRRFREAYLFSSEGDEVLRLISTTVNYFTFPTASRNYGYRLGNTEILRSSFGAAPDQEVLTTLRVGAKTLAQLSADTTRPDDDPDNAAEVAGAFTYFDCTDYVDGPERKGMLTEARNYKARNPTARIPYYEHVKLLIQYAIGGKNRIDVHGGYFAAAAAVTQRLIYRLACLGFAETTKAYGGQATMVNECAEQQIRVMPSKRLEPKYHMPVEPMDTPQSGGS